MDRYILSDVYLVTFFLPYITSGPARNTPRVVPVGLRLSWIQPRPAWFGMFLHDTWPGQSPSTSLLITIPNSVHLNTIEAHSTLVYAKSSLIAYQVFIAHYRGRWRARRDLQHTTYLAIATAVGRDDLISEKG